MSSLVLAAGLLLLAPRSSQASTITFAFQGTATGIGANDMDPALIGVSVPFSGTFTLDDTDLNANTSFGQYGCASCPAWTLEVLGIQVAGTSATATLNVGGSLAINLTNATTSGVAPSSFLYFSLSYGAGVFSDDSLPGAIPFPIAAQSSRIQLYRSSGYDYFFFPVMLTPMADPTPVPEPGSMVLLGTGLLVLARRVTRSRRA